MIADDRQLSPAEKGAYTATLIKNAKAAAGSGGGAAKMTTDPLQGAPQPPGSSPAAFKQAQRASSPGSTATTSPSRSPGRSTRRRWRRCIAIIPALFTGRRLGEHEGHDEMTRSERLEAAGRAEADEAGAPMIDE